MNYLETIKNIAKDKKRKNENLILLLILLVILLISVNYIFNDKDNTNNKQSKNSNNEINDLSLNENKTDSSNNLDKKLEEILSKISGVSDVSVVLSYSNDGNKNIVYNTKEEENEGKKVLEKEVVYNEESGKKTAVIESIDMPQIEGAIVVAKGVNSVDTKSRIASAISAVTNLPAYKIQVFEKGD